MDIVVCMKQVPDVEGRIVIDRGAVTVQALVPSRVINALDLQAVEAALALREEHGGRVTVVTLGDEEDDEALRKAIALGADDAVLLADPTFEGGDSSAVAVALARAIAPVHYDLVLCGRRADDTWSGQVGAALAELLGLPLVQGVVMIEAVGEGLRVHRKLEKGNRQVMECPLPALLTVEAGLNTPRNASIKGVLRARRAEISKRDSVSLGLSAGEVGEAGSKTRRTRLSPPKPKMKGLFVPDSKMSSADKLKMIMGGGIVQKKSDFLEGDPEDISGQLLRFFTEQKIIPGKE
jgi:electron transfer flavoprotein beta subunit